MKFNITVPATCMLFCSFVFAQDTSPSLQERIETAEQGQTNQQAQSTPQATAQQSDSAETKEQGVTLEQLKVWYNSNTKHLTDAKEQLGVERYDQVLGAIMALQKYAKDKHKQVGELIAERDQLKSQLKLEYGKSLQQEAQEELADLTPLSEQSTEVQVVDVNQQDQIESGTTAIPLVEPTEEPQPQAEKKKSRLRDFFKFKWITGKTKE